MNQQTNLASFYGVHSICYANDNEVTYRPPLKFRDLYLAEYPGSFSLANSAIPKLANQMHHKSSDFCSLHMHAALVFLRSLILRSQNRLYPIWKPVMSVIAH